MQHPFTKVDLMRMRKPRAGLRLLVMPLLLALGACAEGSVLAQQTAALLAGGSTAGGVAVQGNVTVGGSDIVIVGQNFTANAGQQMFAVIIDAKTNNLLTQQAGFALVDASGNFQLSWKNLVVPGQHLYVAWYADVNGDAFCNAIPTDNGWEVQLTTLASGSVVAVTPDVEQRSVCELFGSYNMTFDSANGLAGHNYPGHNAYAGIADLFDSSLVGEIQAAKISSAGEVKFSWPKLLLNHHRYATALCVDLADNGSCDSSALYVFNINPVSADVTTPFGNATAQSPNAFAPLWPSNVTLPPPPAADIPTLK